MTLSLTVLAFVTSAFVGGGAQTGDGGGPRDKLGHRVSDHDQCRLWGRLVDPSAAGDGIRTKTLLRVKVHAVGLYADAERGPRVGRSDR